MIIGVPKEIKPDEYRVGLVPAGVRALREEGHTVYIERGAGEGSGISDREYEEAGAQILDDPAEVWARADLIIKVKEPTPIEYAHLREGQILFTYLHLAPAPELTRQLLARKVTGIAYETITDAHGYLPLLTPMSEVAGRMAVQVGATYLQKTHGGRGVLLGGVPGVLPAKVVILGAGVVGTNAVRIAVGMGAHVTVIDKNLDRLRYLDDIFGSQIRTLVSNTHNIWNAIENADLVICGVLIPGAAAPKLITRRMLSCMHKGAVIVDVSVDQGGCVETSRPTTHSDPVFFVDDVLHYCVPNMPGAVPRTSTFALTNVTLPYAVKLASMGLRAAVQSDPGLKMGVNTHKGYVTHPAVAESQGLEYTPLEEIE
jgi:alanine dehydrogenase